MPIAPRMCCICFADFGQGSVGQDYHRWDSCPGQCAQDAGVIAPDAVPCPRCGQPVNPTNDGPARHYVMVGETFLRPLRPCIPEETT